MTIEEKLDFIRVNVHDFTDCNVDPPFKKLHNETDINTYTHTNAKIENKVIIFLGILHRKLIIVLEVSFTVL